MPAVERLFRGAGQFGCVRIIRFECGQFISRLREMVRDLSEARRDFLLLYLLLAEDFEKFDHRSRSEPPFRRQLGRFRFGLPLASVVAAI
jgi:hypothetical protein